MRVTAHRGRRPLEPLGASPHTPNGGRTQRADAQCVYILFSRGQAPYDPHGGRTQIADTFFFYRGSVPTQPRPAHPPSASAICIRHLHPPSASAICIRHLHPPSASAICIRLTHNGGRRGFTPYIRHTSQTRDNSQDMSGLLEHLDW
jgi:hypothetical protein